MQIKKTYNFAVRKWVSLFLFLCCALINSQEIAGSDYYSIRQKFENLDFNDSAAIPFIKEYLAKAKKENNLEELTSAYDYLSVYSQNPETKMAYIDSAIATAKKLNDPIYVGREYTGKGVIFYLNYRKYQPAVENFLAAKKYLENPKDSYERFLKYKNLYYFGVAKSYLGNYEEAQKVFKECLNFYKPALLTKDHPNNIFNFTKGYLNCTVQLALTYQNLNKFDEAEKLIREGFEHLPPDQFENEESYLLQARGINNFHFARYTEALADFKKSSSIFRKEEDFGREQINNLFIGKTYQTRKIADSAEIFYIKNDSIFSRHKFLFPQTREGYEFLINRAKETGDKDKQLYYTSQLLKADSIMQKDFAFLSEKIHKEYDTQRLLEEKEKLENKNSGLNYLVWVLGAFLLSAVVTSAIFRNREKKIRLQYDKLEKKFLHQQEKKESSEIPLKSIPENEVRSDIAENDWKILALLNQFEKGSAFTQKGYTVSKMAEELNVGTSELSRIINQHKGVNFSKYLSTLRIKYITDKLFSDKKYLEYKVEALALECGIASRQNFSDLFTEINGMRPKDFIALRRKELGISG